MKPPPRTKLDYEKVPVDEWVKGNIAEIQRDENRETEFQGEKKVRDMVRFKFAIEGCQYPHYSRWMGFSYAEKANLYKKFLTPLVEEATPDMDFDLDILKGMDIKMMWANNGEFQNLEMVRPLDKKRTKDDIPF